ncbi:hypothetical protein N9R43_01190 [bacterium]|nr:hypothetical protein [bacterium]
MKIGLSFSRCVRDIFEGIVKFDDVLVIVTRTDVDPHNDNHWNALWEGYTQGGFAHPEWSDHKGSNDDFRKLAMRLYDNGKIHQPRQFKLGNPVRLPYYWLDLVVPVDDLEELPALKAVWEQYQILAGLCY